MGNAAESLVKKKLWTYGYKVIDVSKRQPYDMIVDERYKVEVKYSSFYAKDGRVYWELKNVNIKNFDVLAIVLQMPNSEFEIYYLKDLPVLEKNDWLINAMILKNYKFQKNPRKVFIGEPKKIDFPEDVLILKTGIWYTLQETAELIETSQYFTKQYIKAKLLRAVKIGKDKGVRYAIKGDWIVEYLAKKPV